MIWVLKNFYDTNELLLDWTIYQLDPNLDDKGWQSVMIVASSFSPPLYGMYVGPF